MQIYREKINNGYGGVMRELKIIEANHNLHWAKENLEEVTMPFNYDLWEENDSIAEDIILLKNRLQQLEMKVRALKTNKIILNM